MFRERKFQFTALKFAGYLAIVLYDTVKLYTGIDKPWVMLGPIYFGTIFLLLVLFSYSDMYRLKAVNQPSLAK